MSGSSGNIYSPGGGDLNSQNQQYQQLAGGNASALTGYAPAVSQQVQGLTNQFSNNPYAGQAQTGANAAGAYGTGTVVPGQQQGQTALQGAGNANAGYVGQALAQGFDPQNALYNQKFQQSQDQQNAINSMNGVSGTPYAAGVSGQAGQNFNTDWLNQALGRQGQAANTAATLTGSANTGYSGASSLGQQAVQTQAGASGLPSSTYQQNIMDQLKALAGGTSAVSGATGATDQGLSQILSYLGYGTNATNAQQQQSNQTMQGIGQLGGSLAALAFL
jgi:hypothetical protein